MTHLRGTSLLIIGCLAGYLPWMVSCMEQPHRNDGTDVEAEANSVSNGLCANQHNTDAFHDRRQYC